jgi:hypothetical protein
MTDVPFCAIKYMLKNSIFINEINKYKVYQIKFINLTQIQ